ncbi:MBL fold metallo-hydrolase [Paremcibacter congregatus]|uniref:MBL fold metallo-hydrolase n=1 Tax=Paremcibacter congregatus TaxID=2043170 RepID=UPI0030EE8EA8|tara:strand:+ start:5608 stop:6525 length:918 start_codon:yes stop_codon:yes gene_type:complete
MLRKLTLTALAITAITGITPSAALAQDNQYDTVNITTTKVGDGVYMLQGAGGNIGVSAGEDGVFMIDDQFSPLTPKILAAISAISKKPVKFLINTHWHYDHTGGNENLGQQGVVIVAHDNVYKRMSTDQMIEAFNKEIPASPRAALPVVSFNDEVTFHLNDLHIKARHFSHAHTDGDSVILFQDRNIIHMGDLFFNGMYPFVDRSSGGSLAGVIAAVGKILELCDQNTKIIPGHGPLATTQDLKDYHAMMQKAVSILTPLAQKGLSTEEVIKLNPLKELNDKWGGGFMKPEAFITINYPGIADAS